MAPWQLPWISCELHLRFNGQEEGNTRDPETALIPLWELDGDYMV